jgi:hypothetical protein
MEGTPYLGVGVIFPPLTLQIEPGGVEAPIEHTEDDVDEISNDELQEFVKKWKDYANENGFEFSYDETLLKEVDGKYVVVEEE